MLFSILAILVVLAIISSLMKSANRNVNPSLNQTAFELALEKFTRLNGEFNEMVDNGTVSYLAVVNYTVEISSQSNVHSSVTVDFNKNYTWFGFRHIRPYFGLAYVNNGNGSINFSTGTTFTKMLENVSSSNILRSKDEIYNLNSEGAAITFQTINFQGGKVKRIVVTSIPTEQEFYNIATGNISQIFSLPQYKIHFDYDTSYNVSGATACLEFPIYSAEYNYVKISVFNKILNHTFVTDDTCVQRNVTVENKTILIDAYFPYKKECEPFSITEVCFE